MALIESPLLDHSPWQRKFVNASSMYWTISDIDITVKLSKMNNAFFFLRTRSTYANSLKTIMTTEKNRVLALRSGSGGGENEQTIFQVRTFFRLIILIEMQIEMKLLKINNLASPRSSTKSGEWFQIIGTAQDVSTLAVVKLRGQKWSGASPPIENLTESPLPVSLGVHLHLVLHVLLYLCMCCHSSWS